MEQSRKGLNTERRMKCRKNSLVLRGMSENLQLKFFLILDCPYILPISPSQSYSLCKKALHSKKLNEKKHTKIPKK